MTATADSRFAGLAAGISVRDLAAEHDKSIDVTVDGGGAALDKHVQYFTTLPGAHAVAEAVAALRRGPLTVRALQDDRSGSPSWAARLR